jgi:hypothetical protein
MSSFIAKFGSLGALCVAGLSACSLNPGAKTEYADGMTADQYRAAYQIADARCDRQTNSCSSFASRDECIAAKLDLSAADARLRRCSHRVDPSDVNSCVAQIEHGQCGSGITQLSACKKAELCPYTSEEGTL